MCTCSKLKICNGFKERERPPLSPPSSSPRSVYPRTLVPLPPFFSYIPAISEPPPPPLLSAGTVLPPPLLHSMPTHHLRICVRSPETKKQRALLVASLLLPRTATTFTSILAHLSASTIPPSLLSRRSVQRNQEPPAPSQQWVRPRRYTTSAVTRCSTFSFRFSAFGSPGATKKSFYRQPRWCFVLPAITISFLLFSGEFQPSFPLNFV